MSSIRPASPIPLEVSLAMTTDVFPVLKVGGCTCASVIERILTVWAAQRSAHALCLPDEVLHLQLCWGTARKSLHNESWVMP